MIIHGRFDLEKPAALFFFFKQMIKLKLLLPSLLFSWTQNNHGNGGCIRPQPTVKITPLLFFLERSLSEDESDLASSSSSSSLSSSRRITSERHSLLQNALYPLKTKTKTPKLNNTFCYLATL